MWKTAEESVSEGCDVRKPCPVIAGFLFCFVLWFVNNILFLNYHLLYLPVCQTTLFIYLFLAFYLFIYFNIFIGV